MSVMSVTVVVMDRRLLQGLDTEGATVAKTRGDYRFVQSTLTVRSAPPRVGRWMTGASDAGTAGRRNRLHRAGSAA